MKDPHIAITCGDTEKCSKSKGTLQNRSRAKTDLLTKRGRIHCHGG